MKLKELNFHEISVICDYEILNDDCVCENVCKCYTIVDPVVTDINIKTMSSRINAYLNVQATFHKKVNLYFIDRILRLNKIYDNSNYRVTVASSYYGEEIQGIYLKNEVATRIQTQLTNLVNEDTFTEQVKYLLTLEYGYLIDTLKNKKFFVEEIHINDLKLREELDVKLFNSYNDRNYDNIRCIVEKTTHGYKIIDGHHRVASTAKDFVTAIVAK